MVMIEKILTEARKRGLDQTALAECVRIPRNRISKWKGGQGEPTARQIYEISKALELPVLYFLDDAITEPGDVPASTEDERAILRVFRASKLKADTSSRP
jgi:transcriptional regulator with XRE-family HTH domain